MCPRTSRPPTPATSASAGDWDLADFLYNNNFSGVSISEEPGNPLPSWTSTTPRLYCLAAAGHAGRHGVSRRRVRVNESFGDTVNMDLIPESAISTVTLMSGSNPVFGLNTLGGALAVQTKTA